MKPKILLCLALVLSGGFTVRNCVAGIVFPQAPDGAREIASTNAAMIQKMDHRCLGGVSVGQLTVTEPFRNYYVGPRDLATGHLLPASRPGSWTYLFMCGTNAVGSEDLMPDSKTGVLKFAGLYDTDLSMEALRIAEQLPQVEKQDYEVRRLECPSILFRAIWLHGKMDDIIIPLPNTFGRWFAYKPYSEREMIKLLKPEAKKKLAEPPGLFD
jgi:hypothetical protein